MNFLCGGHSAAVLTGRRSDPLIILPVDVPSPSYFPKTVTSSASARGNRLIWAPSSLRARISLKRSALVAALQELVALPLADGRVGAALRRRSARIRRQPPGPAARRAPPHPRQPPGGR